MLTFIKIKSSLELGISMFFKWSTISYSYWLHFLHLAYVTVFFTVKVEPTSAFRWHLVFFLVNLISFNSILN